MALVLFFGDLFYTSKSERERFNVHVKSSPSPYTFKSTIRLKNVSGSGTSTVYAGGGKRLGGNNFSSWIKEAKYNFPFYGSCQASCDAFASGDIPNGIGYLGMGVFEVFTLGAGYELSGGTKALNTSVKSIIGNIKIPVYRVYGGASKINGWSWTPINPKLMPKSMFRKYAGLPDVNWGTGYIKGSTQLKDITLFRKALLYDGNPGGLPELIINPNKVNMWRYMIRPGIYNSYWGF